MLVFPYISNTKNIHTFSEESTVIFFHHIMKDADIDLLKKIDPPSIIQKFSTHNYNLFHLNQEYQYFDANIADKPLYPFMLFPLFKIRDLDNKEVHHSFFQNCNFNVIYNFNKLISIGYFNKFLEAHSAINLNIGGRNTMNLRNYVTNNVNGHFIFKDPDSNCAMLYYGVMLNSSVFQDPRNEFTKLYQYYILSRGYNAEENIHNDMLYPEGITIELEINISQLLAGISGLIYTEHNQKQSFFLRLNKKLQNSIIKICLKGEMSWGQLYFRIFKYSNGEEINDLFLEMFLKNNTTPDFYDDFKRRLISKEHHYY